MAVSRDPEFRTVRMREGYDLDAVDDFVDRVIDALEGRGSGRALTPEQIEEEEFKVVRVREGYVMDDVDDWLDAAAADLRRLRKSQGQGQGQAPGQAPGYQSAPPAPAPPAIAPPAVYPTAPAPAPPPVYPGYQDTTQGTLHGTSHGFDPASAFDTGHGFDPLTDTALNELDPALRALEPSWPPQQGYEQQTQAGAGPDQHGDEQSLSNAATPSTGLHHVEVWVRDLEVAANSFGWLFERLGWTLFQVWDNGRSWQSPGGGPYVVVERSPDLTWVAYDRKAPGLNHLALAVPERWMVDRIVSEAPNFGWHLMFADRHPYAGGAHHYAAYMENDEGFEVEVVAP